MATDGPRVGVRRVVYVTSRWGEPSQTFVRREAEAIAARGIDVVAVSLKRVGPVPGPIPSVHLRPTAVALGVARELARHPCRVLAVFVAIAVVCRSRNILRHWVAAAIGIAGVRARREEHAVVHAQFGWVAATAAWAGARVAGVPFTVYLHAFEIHDSRYMDRFSPTPLRAAGAVFVESERDRGVVAERWGVASIVARLGIPRAWLEWDDTERADDTIVSVGRLVAKKGHDVLLDAIRVAKYPWRCTIIGDGPLEAELRQRAATLGVAARVSFVGAQPEEVVRAELRRATVSCLASVELASGDRDGTPMALIEAMAAGAPVVATDVGAISELVGDSGVVVPASDPPALAAALDELWSDPDRRRRLADDARARVEAEWLVDVSVARVLGAMAELVAVA